MQLSLAVQYFLADLFAVFIAHNGLTKAQLFDPYAFYGNPFYGNAAFGGVNSGVGGMGAYNNPLITPTSATMAGGNMPVLQQPLSLSPYTSPYYGGSMTMPNAASEFGRSLPPGMDYAQLNGIYGGGGVGVPFNPLGNPTGYPHLSNPPFAAGAYHEGPTRSPDSNSMNSFLDGLFNVGHRSRPIGSATQASPAHALRLMNYNSADTSRLAPPPLFDTASQSSMMPSLFDNQQQQDVLINMMDNGNIHSSSPNILKLSKLHNRHRPLFSTVY